MTIVSMALRALCLSMFGLLLAFGAALPAADSLQIKVYPLGLTDVDTGAKVVRVLLSPVGRLVEDLRNHRLIVTDRPEVHERIAAALEQIRFPARNVRIAVTHNMERTDDRRSIEASGGGRVGDARVGVGRDPPTRGVEIRGSSARSRARSQTRQELLVLSGGRASIQVAEQIPYADWFWAWGAPYGLWAGGVGWKDVGASMVVEPLVLDEDRLRVRLTPAFSYLLDRERLLTEIHQLTTEVLVREGDEIDLGGIPMSNREFLDRFLVGYDERGSTQRVRITFRATIE